MNYKCPLAFCLFLFFSVSPVLAANQNFTTLVFPIRGREYWRQSKNIQELESITDLVLQYKLPSTWLLHYDVFWDQEVLDTLPKDAEMGIFLEVTRKLAEASFVKYDWENGSWSDAAKVFLSGYSQEERRRMIDKAFRSFKDKFGEYPDSYGVWYVDVWSMEYIRDKYQANIVLGLADQYSTDGYREWGQYLNLPYFVSKKSAIEPAADIPDSTQILKVQWAPRHPALFLGSSFESSNYSAQVNDYHRQKGLGQPYFKQLLNDILLNVSGKIAQTVIGIEVGELEEKYFPELEAQLKTISELDKQQSLNAVTMQQFNKEYRKLYSSVSPPATMSASANGENFTWTMTPRYRLGTKNSTPIDLRYYHISQYRDWDQLLPDSRSELIREVPATSPSSEILIPETRKLKPGHTVYGGYSGKWPLFKSLVVNLSKLTPDFVYTNLDGQKYFGLRTGFESMVGFRIPKVKFGKFDFKFPLMENFVSLRKKLTPNYPWEGKAEIENQ